MYGYVWNNPFSYICINGYRNMLWVMTAVLLLFTSCLLTTAANQQSSSSPSSSAAASASLTPELRTEHVCFGDINVRHAIENFEPLKNCTVIEGNLQIDHLNYKKKLHKKCVFPKLREITGYLLLFRVDSLPSLELLFPNLAVIRGRTLFHSYALVLFEVQHLEDIGLYSLTRIVRGGVRIERNPKLCFVNTINWSLLSDGKEDHFVKDNKDPQDCIEMCPKDRCSTMRTLLEDGREHYKQTLCWNEQHCQIECPRKCGKRPCYSKEDTSGRTRKHCCHQECLGGCNGPLATDCVACQTVFHNGTCLPECPDGMYSFQGRRCLTATECRSLTNTITLRHLVGYHKLLDNWSPLGRQCTPTCPPGYTEDSNDPHVCVKCVGQCPKVCDGAMVDNVAAARRLKGCTVIRGTLEIQIRSGDNIGAELEENLGMIEEVKNYIKIVRSNSLVSLGFLKNLRIIRGENLHFGKFALNVLDNVNLLDMWDVEKSPHNLTIENGLVSFHMNRRLCLDKIHEFINHINFLKGSSGVLDERQVSTETNGDLVGCTPKVLNLTAVRIYAHFAMIKWNTNTGLGDMREYLSWTVNYRETNDENITIYSGRNACGVDEWETKDTRIDPDYNSTGWVDILFPLKPSTKYAVFVESYTIKNAKSGAISPLVFFTTLPDRQ